VPPVAEAVERNDIPRRALFVGEEQRLGARSRPVERAFHPPLLDECLTLPGERLEHLEVHQTEILDVAPEVRERRTLDVDVFVPGDHLVELLRERLARHA
jgi:hypothetical protein